MVLVTRCPHCNTAFKVVADQLRVRNGLVRCGSCSTVFDGRACLEGGGEPPVLPVASSAAPASPAATPQVNAPPALQTPVSAERAAPFVPPVSPTPAPASPEPHLPSWHAPAAAEPPAVLRGRDRHAEPQIDPVDDEVDETEPDDDVQQDTYHGHIGRAPSFRAYEPEDDQNEPGFTVGAARDEAQDSSEPGIYSDVRTRFSSATDVGRAPPEFLDQDRIGSSHTRRKVWAWLCLLGLLALAAQLIYVYRTPIAVATPMLRPVLEAVCAPLGCKVGYARRIERIFIESSSLRPPQGAAQSDDDGRSKLILAAVLRNRFDKDQEWPAVTLSLTDMSDTVIARKIILPETYLPPGTTGPMAAGAEVTIAVPIVVSGGLQVNGYQLDKFFP